MPIQIPFDTGWQFITFLLLFCYYLSSKVHSLFKLGDQFLTMGLHRTFDVYFKVCPTFLGDPVHIQRFNNVYVLPRRPAAWVVISGSYEPVNMATFIGNIVPLVVTVAINRTRFVHDQVPPDVSRLTFGRLNALGKCTVHLIPTDGSGGGPNIRYIVCHRLRRSLRNRFPCG